MSAAYLVAARRTAVAPRNGAFKAVEVDELGETPIRPVLSDAVIAGGVESFSRAPLRARRPRDAGEAPQPYDRPPFAPWPERDPDMIAAAGTLAEAFDIPTACFVSKQAAQQANP